MGILSHSHCLVLWLSANSLSPELSQAEKARESNSIQSRIKNICHSFGTLVWTSENFQTSFSYTFISQVFSLDFTVYLHENPTQVKECCCHKLRTNIWNCSSNGRSELNIFRCDSISRISYVLHSVMLLSVTHSVMLL